MDERSNLEESGQAYRARSSRHFLQQGGNLALQMLQLLIDHGNWARRDVFVEIAIEVDLVAYTSDFAVLLVA
jgi:hypothetical protein